MRNSIIIIIIIIIIITISIKTVGTNAVSCNVCASTDTEKPFLQESRDQYKIQVNVINEAN